MTESVDIFIADIGCASDAVAVLGQILDIEFLPCVTPICTIYRWQGLGLTISIDLSHDMVDDRDMHFSEYGTRITLRITGSSHDCDTLSFLRSFGVFIGSKVHNFVKTRILVVHDLQELILKIDGDETRPEPPIA